MRDEFSLEWEEYGKEEARLAWEALRHPQVVETLRTVMESLSGNKSKL